MKGAAALQSPFQIMRSKQLSLYRVSALKRLPVYRYNVIFAFSGPLRLLVSDIRKQIALKQVLDGVRNDAFPVSLISRLNQTSNFIGSLYFRSVPFSDYFETSKEVLIGCETRLSS